MEKFYTEEKNAQIIISLLKQHGIKRVIASPGTTNMALTASMQNDNYFEMYSSVDERSAAYMACGLAAETGEPVVLSCTGATASRNYLPGLTEAYYRKLQVLSITSMQATSKVGHLHAQMLDRSVMPNDVVKLSLQLPIVKDDSDKQECIVKVNKAILELKRNGGGPVHLNLQTTYSRNFSIKELPIARKIERITQNDEFPTLPKGKIAVFVGSHKIFSEEETKVLDKFCSSNNAVVFCDHTSGYHGKFRMGYSLVAFQKNLSSNTIQPILLIQIGEITGDYYSLKISGTKVWRVSEDGEIRDTYKKLTNVFEMPEKTFFNNYITSKVSHDYFDECKLIKDNLKSKIKDVPFSNIWIASQLANKIPKKSNIHFAILNSLRAWNFFDLPHNSITSNSNVGGFGIDGCVSSLIGASLANKDKLYFGVIGDLALFYDLNVLGNRHVGNNVRILLINNGVGTEFINFSHSASNMGKSAEDYIAAGGHFGNQSHLLIKNFAENLGFDYRSAKNKSDFDEVYEDFTSSKISNRSMLFEVFTNSAEESEALELLGNLDENIKGKTKNAVKQVLGKKGIGILRNLTKK